LSQSDLLPQPSEPLGSLAENGEVVENHDGRSEPLALASNFMDTPVIEEDPNTAWNLQDTQGSGGPDKPHEVKEHVAGTDTDNRDSAPNEQQAEAASPSKTRVRKYVPLMPAIKARQKPPVRARDNVEDFLSPTRLCTRVRVPRTQGKALSGRQDELLEWCGDIATALGVKNLDRRIDFQQSSFRPVGGRKYRPGGNSESLLEALLKTGKGATASPLYHPIDGRNQLEQHDDDDDDDDDGRDDLGEDPVGPTVDSIPDTAPEHVPYDVASSEGLAQGSSDLHLNPDEVQEQLPHSPCETTSVMITALPASPDSQPSVTAEVVPDEQSESEQVALVSHSAHVLQAGEATDRLDQHEPALSVEGSTNSFESGRLSPSVLISSGKFKGHTKLKTADVRSPSGLHTRSPDPPSFNETWERTHELPVHLSPTHHHRAVRNVKRASVLTRRLHQKLRISDPEDVPRGDNQRSPPKQLVSLKIRPDAAFGRAQCGQTLTFIPRFPARDKPGVNLRESVQAPVSVGRSVGRQSLYWPDERHQAGSPARLSPVTFTKR